MPVWLGIAIGGAAGALTRHWLTGAVQQRADLGSWTAFPLGTLAVNIAGCFLLGCLLGLADRNLIGQGQRLALGTGFVGSFTTFSTFVADADSLIRGSLLIRTLAYTLASLGLGYLAFLAGRLLLRNMVSV
jgi:CrcB protein